MKFTAEDNNGLKLIGKKKTIKVHPDSYDFQNLEKYFFLVVVQS